MKPTIRLIAMDMDGTLLNPAQQLSRENRLALLDAHRAGIRLAICSGRMPGDSALFALENRLEQIAILGLNGGCCQLSPVAAPYANHVLPAPLALACCRLCAEKGMTFGLFLRNQVVIFQGKAELRRCDWGGHWDTSGAPVMTYGGNMEQLAAQGINKIVCVEEDPAALSAVRKEMKKLDGLQVTSSWVNNLELMPAGVDKGLAVRELAQHLGLDLSQVMVIGDYDNDLSMFRCAGFAVAMGNASEAVKAAAHAVTLTNAEDGVAYAIRKWALEKA
ncbi:MAG: HAD family phosphatase [Clostridiales bacterium]|nr:HAD family phosphatase [Clostridiales bacterium]